MIIPVTILIYFTLIWTIDCFYKLRYNHFIFTYIKCTFIIENFKEMLPFTMEENLCLLIFTTTLLSTLSSLRIPCLLIKGYEFKIVFFLADSLWPTYGFLIEVCSSLIGLKCCSVLHILKNYQPTWILYLVLDYIAHQ